MKTLIIHPADESTTFLDIVYKDIPDKTVIQGGVSKTEIREMIDQYDRVMMMGHGAPSGLFSMGRFDKMTHGFIIDGTMVEALSKKDNSVFIWCNADKFVNNYNLKGFFSGMFISEVGEASYCGLPGTPQDIVDESNYGFVNIIGKYINEDTNSIYDKVKQEYGVMAENNPVALYNHMRLYKS